MHRADVIKQLLLSGQSFEKPLACLYTELRLHKKYTWIIEIYQWLCLYAAPGEIAQLQHPALLQAYISLGKMEKAHQLASQLQRLRPRDPEVQKLILALHSRAENILPDYTPLATLSRYAATKTAKKAANKLDLPFAWATALAQITPETLQEIGYYRKVKQLAKIPKKYRSLVLKIFDEMVLNHLFQHERSVVGLSGALLEILLAIDLFHNRGLQHMHIKNQRKHVFDLTLHELVGIYSKENWLPPEVLRLCKAARVQRNFIHPGKEFLEQNRLSAAGANICFCAVLEVIDALQ